jgi:hypothetical protein
VSDIDTERQIDAGIAGARRRIDLIERFMKDIEQAGGAVPGPLKQAVDRYTIAIKLGTDAAEAANEVSRELRGVYQDMYAICREKAGFMPGQPQTAEQGDEYMICAARVDRQFARQNVQKVLNWDDDRSWVRKVWSKWWNRLLTETGFVDEAKKDANLPADGPKPMQ